MDGSFWSWSRGGGAAKDDVVASLADSTTRMAQDMDALKQRLHALETTQPPMRAASGGADAARDAAVPERARQSLAVEKSVSWRDRSAGKLSLSGKPPIRRIKFRDQSPRNAPTENKTGDGGGENGDEDAYDSGDDSSAYSCEEDPIAFTGWARVFFQARRDRAATQVTAPSTPFLDTHLHLTIHATANELRISDSDDRRRPLLIDPPISLRHFYAARVPGSRSGAALFLRNDKRRLRKYIFRFEFPNRAAHQPPQLYAHFSRSGAAAKNSRRALHKVRKKAFALMGEERREQLQRDQRRGEDALAAHLATLDELLRESDEAAERFVECVNARNEEEEELARHSHGRVGSGRRKRAKPLPPYWGSGYNRPNTNKDDVGDDDGDSESADSEEEEELDYDDDDETTFDKVKVSTEQTLETLWKHIVK